MPVWLQLKRGLQGELHSEQFKAQMKKNQKPEESV